MKWQYCLQGRSCSIYSIVLWLLINIYLTVSAHISVSILQDINTNLGGCACTCGVPFIFLYIQRYTKKSCFKFYWECVSSGFSVQWEWSEILIRKLILNRSDVWVLMNNLSYPFFGCWGDLKSIIMLHVFFQRWTIRKQISIINRIHSNHR